MRTSRKGRGLLRRMGNIGTRCNSAWSRASGRGSIAIERRLSSRCSIQDTWIIRRAQSGRSEGSCVPLAERAGIRPLSVARDIRAGTTRRRTDGQHGPAKTDPRFFSTSAMQGRGTFRALLFADYAALCFLLDSELLLEELLTLL